MNEKTKKEGYTDQLNQELLGTLGEKASSEQISAAYEKREVHRDTTYHKTNTKHASPWKDTDPADSDWEELDHLSTFISTLTNRRPAGKSEKIYLWVFFCEERFVFLEKRRKKHIL